MPRTPITSYRLQLGPDLSFDQARARLPYLHDLGVTDLYLSPILTAAPGSTHGYDVVDHNQISEVMGGRAGLERLADAAHERDMGIIVDIVPNHMAIPTPAHLNAPLWSVLAHGQQSPYAAWFDIDWSPGPLLMPVLGEPVSAVIDAGAITLESAPAGTPGSRVLRYFDQLFPVRDGTEDLPLPELIANQHYRLEYWKIGDSSLNYRRFFDVATLIGIRVEVPEVFDATHALILDLMHAGYIDGLRVDHPDGLADPEGYFRRLHHASNGAWTVAEKILEPDEQLPHDWPVAGTTGYDGAWRLGQVQIDPSGFDELATTMTELTGDRVDELPAMIEASKRQITQTSLEAEMERLTASVACALDVADRSPIRQCLRELVVACDRYRAYLVPGQPAPALSLDVLQHMADRARAALPPDHGDALEAVVDVVRGGIDDDQHASDAIIRFQQVCGAVMAKGVEDTTFYRWTHLISLCEVGGAPGRFAIEPAELHEWAQNISTTHPASMTNGATHDSKRGEDVRARIGVLSQLSRQWRTLVQDLRAATADHRPSELSGRTENLLWQTLAGTWTDAGPIDAKRLTDYLVKASREGKDWTSWTDVNESGEAELARFTTAVVISPAVTALMDHWLRLSAAAARTAILSTKALQLTLPGVADIYQGTETTRIALVDPDNRGPVDADELAQRLARLDAGAPALTLADEKLALTAAITRLRRRHPDAFVGPKAGYQPLVASTDLALAFTRLVEDEPQIVTIATRLHTRLQDQGGWGSHTIALPPGRWRDVVCGRAFAPGAQPLADICSTSPVVVLEREAHT